MKNKIYYSQEALTDLDEIWNYITTDLSNPDAATNVVNQIINIIDTLEDFSEMGAPLSSIVDIETDYRFLVSGSYIIFYRPQGSDIFVDRVLYERRNYINLLFPDFST